jgi:hypothetical protein
VLVVVGIMAEAVVLVGIGQQLDFLYPFQQITP